MKKVVSLALALVLLFGLLAVGCTGSGASSTSEGSSAASQSSETSDASTESSDNSSSGEAASTDSSKVKLTFWTWNTHLERMIPEYLEKNNLDMEIEVTIMSMDDIDTKLTTAFSAGSGVPDLLQIERTYVPKYRDSKKLENLSQSPYDAEEQADQFFGLDRKSVV